MTDFASHRGAVEIALLRFLTALGISVDPKRDPGVTSISLRSLSREGHRPILVLGRVAWTGAEPAWTTEAYELSAEDVDARITRLLELTGMPTSGVIDFEIDFRALDWLPRASVTRYALRDSAALAAFESAIDEPGLTATRLSEVPVAPDKEPDLRDTSEDSGLPLAS